MQKSQMAENHGHHPEFPRNGLAIQHMLHTPLRGLRQMVPIMVRDTFYVFLVMVLAPTSQESQFCAMIKGKRARKWLDDS